VAFRGHPRPSSVLGAKADTRSVHLLTQQYLEAVLGLCWRFATSFSAQASLFDDSTDIFLSIDRALLPRCLLCLYRNCFLRCYTRSVANR
jgi:hypothetical protein